MSHLSVRLCLLLKKRGTGGAQNCPGRIFTVESGTTNVLKAQHVKRRKKSARSGTWQNSSHLPIRWLGVCLLVVVAGCTTADEMPLDRHDNLMVLLNPELELNEDWEHKRLRRSDTTYERVQSALGQTIKATGNKSASILYRFFEPTTPECNRLRWSWFVAKPQSGADLHVKGRDDVAASIFVLFGDPGMFRDKLVPALKYVWTNEQHRVGEVIVGPYRKKYVRTLIVRTGSPTDQRLVIEQVNLWEDYLRAFGETPPNGIFGIAIFTDNDDTQEAIVAHYGRIELLCDAS